MTALTGKMQQRRDTAANWTSNNPTLAAGEIGLENDTGLIKIGDGSTAWTSLKYFNREFGTYTPTLSGLTIGSGGTPLNTANYTWEGGPLVGSRGLLTIEGTIKFGTSGQSFPVHPILVSFPSGFQFDDSTTASNPPVGWVSLVDADAGPNVFLGAVMYNTQSQFKFVNWNVASTYPNLATITTTAPFTWASNDELNWRVQGIRAERV